MAGGCGSYLGESEGAQVQLLRVSLLRPSEDRTPGLFVQLNSFTFALISPIIVLAMLFFHGQRNRFVVHPPFFLPSFVASTGSKERGVGGQLVWAIGIV